MPQPSGALIISPSAPISFNLGYIGGFATDLIGGQTPVNASGLTESANSIGMALNVPGNNTAHLSYSDKPATALTAFTVIGVFIWNGGLDYPQLAGTGGYGNGFVFANNGGNQFALVKSGIGTAVTIDLVANVPYVLVASTRQDTGETYIKAKRLDTNAVLTPATATNTAVSNAPLSTWRVGSSRTDYNGSWAGSINMVLMSSQFLSSTDADAVIADPWVYIEVSGGSAVTHASSGSISASSGTLSGTAARAAATVTHAATGSLAAGASTLAASSARSVATVAHAGSAAITAANATVTGSASRSATGQFVTDILGNNTESVLVSVTVLWEWRLGAGIGVAPTSVTYGTGTTNSLGILTVSGLPAGAGELLIATPDRSFVAYETGAVA